MSIGPIDSSTSALSFSQQSHSAHRHQPPAMTDTAQLLGISTSQLQSDLQSGQKLSSLASSAGVSSSDLLSGVESDLKANAPQGAPSLSDQQLQQIASDFIDGTGFGSTQGSGSGSSLINGGGLYDQYV